MALGTKIVIDNRIGYNGEFKKYPSTQEQIERNQRDKDIQRQRDEQAQARVSGSGNNSSRVDHNPR